MELLLSIAAFESVLFSLFLDTEFIALCFRFVAQIETWSNCI